MCLLDPELHGQAGRDFFEASHQTWSHAPIVRGVEERSNCAPEKTRKVQQAVQ
jgi:hypothetical protein